MTARVRFWLALLALILFSRIFQTQVLWPEETLPLATAQQVLAGRTLYRDVWFDKPPLLAWFYAAVMRAADHSGYGLRLIGALYILAITLAGYGLARRLWGEAEARWAAFFLAFFTGFYIHSAVAPLAADLLMLLPHLLAFYFLASGWTWAAGVCAGLALHLNSKALFVLAAAAGWLIIEGAARKLLPLLAGFAAAVAAILGLVALSGGWSGYIDEVWRWGLLYAQAPFSDHPWALGAERTLHYLGFHAALVAGAAAFFWNRDRYRRAILLWLILSFVAVAAGGRFFPRYYFQVLPPLAMAAAPGWRSILSRPALAVALAIALAVPAVRFGRVNLLLALGQNFQWRDTAMDADSRRAAALVARSTERTDSILVWGFRPEIYFYSRRLGASRFLESQPLTGVLADRHLERSDAFLPQWAATHRRELAEELRLRPPAVIVDGLGPYNASLGIDNYPELREMLGQYRPAGGTAGTRIYQSASRKGAR